MKSIAHVSVIEKLLYYTAKNWLNYKQFQLVQTHHHCDGRAARGQP